MDSEIEAITAAFQSDDLSVKFPYIQRYYTEYLLLEANSLFEKIEEDAKILKTLWDESLNSAVSTKTVTNSDDTSSNSEI